MKFFILSILLLCTVRGQIHIHFPFQFPANWNPQTDESCLTERYNSVIDKISGELRRHIFEANVVSGKRTVELTVGRNCADQKGASEFCSDWGGNPTAWNIVKKLVKKEVIAHGFSVEEKQHLWELGNVREFFGEYWIISPNNPQPEEIVPV